MTPLKRKITRRSEVTIRDGRKSRRLVVTLYPGGIVGVRPERTRREEFVDLATLYDIVVRTRVARERSRTMKRRKTTRHLGGHL